MPDYTFPDTVYAGVQAEGSLPVIEENSGLEDTVVVTINSVVVLNIPPHGTYDTYTCSDGSVITFNGNGDNDVSFTASESTVGTVPARITTADGGQDLYQLDFTIVGQAPPPPAPPSPPPPGPGPVSCVP